MKKIDCIFYLVDNYLYLYNIKQKKLTNYKFENYIYEGRIIKQNILIKKINEILKKEKLAKVFSNQNAIIIYSPHLKYMDKKIILDTFEQCGFKDIKLINTKDLLDKNKHYIEINNNYIIEYYKNNYTVLYTNKYFNLKTILKIIVKKVDSEIILLGINKDISELAKLNKKLVYLENNNTYYLDKVISRKIM